MPEAEVIDSYGDVKIMRSEDSPFPMYIVLQPEFSPEELEIIKNPKAVVSDYRSVVEKLDEFRTVDEKERFLRQYLEVQLESKSISPENMNRIITMLIDDIFMGYGRLGVLVRDNNLEEIMINGVGIPVFVFHRKHGMCVTNIEYESHESLNRFIDFLARYSGRKIDKSNPLMDAHMPDGSRVNIAISPAAPNGPSITIRKFRKVPYNIIDLISLKSISSDLAAFLWVCIEGFGIHPCNILIAGGSGSGKTTLFNALAMFIPTSERIVTVEDTLELNLEFLRNWVALEASPPTMEKKDARVDMHRLIENSLRMRPDRVLVGEVRGKEAETLFVAMDIGLNGSMGTIHSNNARETTIRLMDEPMNLPIRMFPLLDLIVVMNRYYDRKKGFIRRVTEVAEISGVEKNTVQIGEIYRWEPETDRITRTNYPILLKDKIAKWCNISKKQLNNEILVRQRILEYMLKKGIRNNKDVIDIIQRYNTNPMSVISKIKNVPRYN